MKFSIAIYYGRACSEPRKTVAGPSVLHIRVEPIADGVVNDFVPHELVPVLDEHVQVPVLHSVADRQ